MRSARCTTGNQACWFCSKAQRDRCERVVRDHYYTPVRTPDVTRIIQKRLVWGY